MQNHGRSSSQRWLWPSWWKARPKASPRLCIILTMLIKKYEACYMIYMELKLFFVKQLRDSPKAKWPSALGRTTGQSCSPSLQGYKMSIESKWDFNRHRFFDERNLTKGTFPDIFVHPEKWYRLGPHYSLKRAFCIEFRLSTSTL